MRPLKELVTAGYLPFRDLFSGKRGVLGADKVDNQDQGFEKGDLRMTEFRFRGLVREVDGFTKRIDTIGSFQKRNPVGLLVIIIRCQGACAYILRRKRSKLVPVLGRNFLKSPTGRALQVQGGGMRLFASSFLHGKVILTERVGTLFESPARKIPAVAGTVRNIVVVGALQHRAGTVKKAHLSFQFPDPRRIGTGSAGAATSPKMESADITVYSTGAGSHSPFLPGRPEKNIGLNHPPRFDP